jgi:hypothetical protein
LDLARECFFPLEKKIQKTWERRKDKCSYGMMKDVMENNNI